MKQANSARYGTQLNPFPLHGDCVDVYLEELYAAWRPRPQSFNYSSQSLDRGAFRYFWPVRALQSKTPIHPAGHSHPH